MDLLGIIITLAIVGVLLYLFNTLVTMDNRIKTVINVIVLLAVFLWLLCAFHVYCYHGFHGC
jgi:hypothetical protein